VAIDTETRDAVVDCLRYWSARADLSQRQMLTWLGVPASKYYTWRQRYQQPNGHNAQTPRTFWLLAEERRAILDFQAEHPEEGYRRLCYMMLDANVAAASPSSVYRVLKSAGRINPQRQTLIQGAGVRSAQTASRPLAHRCLVSQYLRHLLLSVYGAGRLQPLYRALEIRETMTEADVEAILQRAREAFSGARPRIISDNGPQFVARDFKAFVRLCGMTHVRTSPYYPQSNGKIESWHKTVKRECIRPLTPLMSMAT